MKYKVAVCGGMFRGDIRFLSYKRDAQCARLKAKEVNRGQPCNGRLKIPK